eukprot:3480967-Amphidinium_carterae.3
MTVMSTLPLLHRHVGPPERTKTACVDTSSLLNTIRLAVSGTQDVTSCMDEASRVLHLYAGIFICARVGYLVREWNTRGVETG